MKKKSFFFKFSNHFLGQCTFYFRTLHAHHWNHQVDCKSVKSGHLNNVVVNIKSNMSQGQCFIPGEKIN